MEKVLCFIPNGHVIMWELSSSNYPEFIHLTNAHIVAKNKTGSSDYSDVIKLWEPAIEKLEPLWEDVRINSMYLNMSYMDDNAIIPKVNIWRTNIISALDRRFLFLSNWINFDKLKDWYIEINNVSNIKSYTWGNWLWAWKFELTKCWDKYLYSIYNLLFLIWKI